MRCGCGSTGGRWYCRNFRRGIQEVMYHSFELERRKRWVCHRGIISYYGVTSVNSSRVLGTGISHPRACWTLPGLGSVSCLSGSVRPLRLVVCVISSLPSVRLSHQKAAACLAIYVSVLPVTVPACIAVMSVTYTSHRAQALTLVFG